MRPRPLTALLVALVVGITAGACGSTGRTLQAPEPGATAPPRSTSTSSSSSPTTKDAVAAFAITSDAWNPGGSLPRRITCDGEGTSPPITISGVPATTVELVLVVTGGATSTEWIVAGIDPATTGFEEGSVPPGAMVVAGGDGSAAWTGLCPEQGAGPVLYEMALYALAAPSELREGMDVDEALDQVFTGEIVGTSILTGTYAR